MLSHLPALCRSLGPELIGPDGATDAEKSAFLLGMTGQESSWGDRWCAVKHEALYARGGTYYNGSADLRRLVARYEDAAACSFGPWQILYVSAWEVGFRGHPWELTDPRVSGEQVVARINQKILQRTVKFGNGFRQEPRPGVDFAAIYRAWNGGLGALESPLPSVVEYAAKQMANLDEAKRILTLNGVKGRPSEVA